MELLLVRDNETAWWHSGGVRRGLAGQVHLGKIHLLCVPTSRCFSDTREEGLAGGSERLGHMLQTVQLVHGNWWWD